MLTMPKCHDCGKFCRPVEWKMIYSGVLLEPQEEIYKCAPCVKKHGSFYPQSGIKPECSCGIMTHNAKVSGAGTASAGLPGYTAGGNGERK